ncbi:MAG TPA: hypothetical protein VHC19_28985 [Pirellulales bacterium]|nr:hypothetical protein [Pirellulales bacterium]
MITVGQSKPDPAFDLATLASEALGFHEVLNKSHSKSAQSIREALAFSGARNVPLPNFNDEGDLPVGVYQASLAEVLERFGALGAGRLGVGLRLKRIYELAHTTSHVQRFVIFGSFVTEKEHPNDVDIFLVMDNAFDPALLEREAQRLFDHVAAQDQFGASVFWLREVGCLEGEQAAVEYWRVKRGGGLRGIVEIIEENP